MNLILSAQKVILICYNFFFVLLWVNFTNTQVLCMYEAGFAKVKTVVCFALQFSSFSTRLKQKSWYYKKILSKTCFPSFFFRSFIMGFYNFWRIIIVFTTSLIILMKDLEIDYLMKMQMNRNKYANYFKKNFTPLWEAAETESAVTHRTQGKPIGTQRPEFSNGLP